MKNKVALVTGGGSGIGKAISLRLAREGAKVVVNGRNAQSGMATVNEIKNAGGTGAFIEGDVSRGADAEKMVKFTVDTYGSLQVLINNAGTYIVKPVLETTEDEWETVMGINMRGVFLLAKQAGLQMVEQGGGSIVNLASIAGLMGFPLLGAYCATKHGVIGLTKTMAIELREKNIRVNAICPAFTDTPMLERCAVEYGQAGFDVPAVVSLRQVRIGRPEEVADAALYLASDESCFINGTTLAVDNGFTGC